MFLSNEQNQFSQYNDDLSPEYQFKLAIDYLREYKQHNRIKRNNWNEYYFNNGWDVFKINYLVNTGDSDKIKQIAGDFCNSKETQKVAWVNAINF